jgi:Zn-finger nucleic acid-binding protein
MDFSCPTCNVLLQAQTLEGTRLWKCASCGGFAISLPTVRKGLTTETFKNIWQKLSSGQIETGRPCPGCKNPLSVVEAGGKGGVVMIDVCRTCHILWFDDNEFSDLPKVVPKVESEDTSAAAQTKRAESRLLTPEELAFAAFEEEQYRRRSFLVKLLDGSVAKELGLDSFFGDYFDK